MTSGIRVIVGILACAGLAMAQETRASLSGIVTDRSGSVAQGAALELTNLETGVVLPAASMRLDYTASCF